MAEYKTDRSSLTDDEKLDGSLRSDWWWCVWLIIDIWFLIERSMQERCNESPVILMKYQVKILSIVARTQIVALREPVSYKIMWNCLHWRCHRWQRQECLKDFDDCDSHTTGKHVHACTTLFFRHEVFHVTYIHVIDRKSLKILSSNVRTGRAAVHNSIAWSLRCCLLWLYFANPATFIQSFCILL